MTTTGTADRLKPYSRQPQTRLDVWDAISVLNRRRDELAGQLDTLKFAVDELLDRGDDTTAASQVMGLADVIQTASVALAAEGVEDGGLSTK